MVIAANNGEHNNALKRHFTEKSENKDKVSVRVRFWVRFRVRSMVKVRTFVFIDVIVCFMTFLLNVFSAQCRRPQ